MLTVIGGIDYQNGTVDPTDCTPSTKTNSAINFYVRDDTGNDSNPGTLALPLKTLTEAESRIPDIVDHTVVIRINSVHSGVGYTIPVFRARVGRASIYIVSELFTELVSSTAALAGSTAALVKSSALTADQYTGKTIEILSGAAIGDRRTIRNNTTTDIIPVCDFSAAVATNDLYRIVEPQVELISPTSEEYYLRSQGFGSADVDIDFYTYIPPANPMIYLVNIRIVDSWFDVNNTALCFFGVEFDFSSINLRNSSIRSGMDSTDAISPFAVAFNVIADLGVTHPYQWAGWGVYLTGLGGGSNRGVFHGFLVSDYNIQDDYYDTKMHLYGGNLRGGVWTGWHSKADFLFWDQPDKPLSPRLIIGNGIGGVEWDASVNCNGGLIHLAQCELYGTKHGILSQGLGRVLSTQVTGTVGQIGAVTANNGSIAFDYTPTVTGSLGDLSPDNGATVYTNATLSASGAALIHRTHGRIFRATHS